MYKEAIDRSVLPDLDDEDVFDEEVWTEIPLDTDEEDIGEEDGEEVQDLRCYEQLSDDEDEDIYYSGDFYKIGVVLSQESSLSLDEKFPQENKMSSFSEN